MGMEVLAKQQSMIPASDKITTIVGDGSHTHLTVYEQTVLVYATAAIHTIYLPNVTEARGLLFSINLIDTTAHTVTVADNDESLGWSDLSLTADGDHVLLYSDGVRWNLIIDVTT